MVFFFVSWELFTCLKHLKFTSLKHLKLSINNDVKKKIVGKYGSYYLVYNAILYEL